MSKTKRRIRPGIKYGLTIIVLIVVGIFVIRSDAFQNAYKSYRLENIGYLKEEAITLINDEEVYQYAKSHDYDPNLSSIVSLESFKVENTLNYLEYIQENEDAPVEDVVYLVNKGINYPYSNLLMDIASQKYFLLTRLQRYMDYGETSMEDSEKIVAKVNANRDYAYYTNTQKANKADQSVILVNKYYNLDKDFNPGLVKIADQYAFYDDMSLNSVAYNHFEELQKDAAKYGYSIYALSAYRSYEDQEKIYNDYKNSYGQSYADKWSARPGFSEHQTGLVIDVVSASNNLGAFEESNEYIWMKDNSYKYGFILRFPSGKEDITGYGAEPWHYRYVGVDAATVMYNEDLTLEEYYAYYVIQK